MFQEEFRPVQGFSRYTVSNYGNVWNVIFERPMRPSRTQEGYLKISLIDNDGVRRSVSLAHLVAQAFVDPPNTRSTDVILLDGDLENVVAHNLQWRTPRQAWLYRRQLFTPQHDNMLYFPIKDLETGQRYDSIYQCGITHGLIFMEILGSCAGSASRPPLDRYVYPYGHRYAFLDRVRDGT